MSPGKSPAKHAGRATPADAPIRKSPLALRSTRSALAQAGSAVGSAPPARPPARTPQQRRRDQLVDFENFLVTTVSKRGRPYAGSSVRCFLEAVGSMLDYLDVIEFDGECQDVTHFELNGYLAWYREANGQGGVVTKQGNLRQFFTWLTDEWDLAENAYTHRKRNVYRRTDVAPPDLSEQFMDDLLATCSGKSYEDLRDNALLRTFMQGLRIGEVEAMMVGDIHLRDQVLQVRPHKLSDDWRLLSMGPSLARAYSRYLRARAEMGQPAEAGQLWISVKRKDGMTASGLTQVIKRRTREAGYDEKAVHPHLFRHASAAEAKRKGMSTEGGMQRHGWKDPAMFLRYGKSAAEERSLDESRRLGLGERR